jgi:ERCC4-type nuclease
MIEATLIIDTREQQPYVFAGCKSIYVAFVVERAGLPVGDYAAYLSGGNTSPGEVCVVERKTHSDLLSTLTHGRERFERELERLAEYGFAALVIESDLPSIARGPQRPDGKWNPRAIVASLVAFAQRFNVHVYFASNRRLAEVYTYRLLERWVRDRAEVAVPA